MPPGRSAELGREAEQKPSSDLPPLNADASLQDLKSAQLLKRLTGGLDDEGLTIPQDDIYRSKAADSPSEKTGEAGSGVKDSTAEATDKNSKSQATERTVTTANAVMNALNKSDGPDTEAVFKNLSNMGWLDRLDVSNYLKQTQKKDLFELMLDKLPDDKLRKGMELLRDPKDRRFYRY